jgi:hypothetical protein
MAKKKHIRQPLRHHPVPIQELQKVDEIDEKLKAVADKGRDAVHAAIEDILKGWPGRKRREIWARFRSVRNSLRPSSRQRAVWSEEDINRVRLGYARGRAGVGEAVKELLVIHPDWKPQRIWRMASKLGLSVRSGPKKPWSHKEEAKLIWDAGMKPVQVIARKLKRTRKAIYNKMCADGVSARVREPKEYTLHRVSRMLGVSDTIVRAWFEEGLFGELNGQGHRNGHGEMRPRIRSEDFIRFCLRNPDKINPNKCTADVLDCLEDKQIKLARWNGSRQHLTGRKACPRCGRVIIGNAFSWHVTHCTGRLY